MPGCAPYRVSFSALIPQRDARMGRRLRCRVNLKNKIVGPIKLQLERSINVLVGFYASLMGHVLVEFRAHVEPIIHVEHGWRQRAPCMRRLTMHLSDKRCLRCVIVMLFNRPHEQVGFCPELVCIGVGTFLKAL